MLFSRGKNFCPVELNPPYIRMQRELDSFFRTIRINWHFRDQQDSRSNLEKKFYLKSDWMPPKACGEIESMIQQIQLNFDKWKAPKYIKDNLSKAERKLIKEIKEQTDVMYMWKDKGPSFTKLKVDQYLQAGEQELNNPDFYENIDTDPTNEIRRKCIDLISNMQKRGEISDRIADYLLSGDVQLSNFYHLVKTHSLPSNSQEIETWLQEKGFPIRGIFSGRGGPN